MISPPIRRPATPLRPTLLAGYAYSDNYLIDLKHAVVIMDVEATTAIRQAGSRRSQDDARIRTG